MRATSTAVDGTVRATVVSPTTITPDSLNQRDATTRNLALSRMADSPLIAGVLWTLAELDGVAIENASGGQVPSLQIDADGGVLKAAGMAGCNRFSGPVTQRGNELRIGPLVATKMACPALQLESKYLAALDAARTFRMALHQLELLSGNRVVARFTAP